MPREDGARTGYIIGRVANLGGILLYDDMEGLIKWENVPGWTASRMNFIGAAAYEGNFGMWQQCRLAVPNGISKAYKGRSFGRSKHKAWSVESLFRGSDVNSCHWFCMAIEWVVGGYRYVAGVSVNCINGVISLADDQGGWRGWAYAGFKPSETAWHRWRMEVDLERGLYRRVELDGAVFDLSGESIFREETAEPEIAWVIIGVGTIRFGLANGYCDCVLVEEV